jgi:Rap1a immunity proteins
MRRRDIVAFFGVAAALAGTLAGEIARAQHDTISTAQYIMPDCRAFVGPALHRGRCCGIVEGLVFAGKGVCAPKTSTTEQAVQIVMQYIEKRPARLDQNFIALALDALKATWPCRSQSSLGDDLLPR